MTLWPQLTGVRLALRLLFWVWLCQGSRRMVRGVHMLLRGRTVCLWFRVDGNLLTSWVSSLLLLRVVRYTWFRVQVLGGDLRLLGLGALIQLVRNRRLGFLQWGLLLVRR
mmetsp:Transcript_98474/g.226272  ORF Transcript_98474/g.226272 Transcript_98474/m.226272 type:complete len:110 (+) Transcript_98474:91-420(+)